MRTEGIPSARAVARAICSGAVHARRRPPPRTSGRTGRAGRDRDRQEVHGAESSRRALRYAHSRGHDEIDRAFAPRSRAHARASFSTRGERSIAEPLQVYLPVFAAEALNSTITDVDGNTFIDFAGGVGVVQRRPLPPACRRGDPGAGGPVRPHRFHGRALCGVRRACRAARRAGAVRRPDARSVLQLGRRGGRERRQDRAARHRPSGRDRLRGGVPRPHDARDDDDVEGAPLQDRHGAVRARGLPGAVPERLPRPVGERGARRARAMFVLARGAVAGRGDRLRAAARRGRLRARRRPSSSRGSAGSATARASS